MPARRESNPRPPDHQSDAHPTVRLRPASTVVKMAAKVNRVGGLDAGFQQIPLIGSPEHEMLKVSYCDRSVSVVVRRPSCASTICLKAYSYSPGPNDSKLGRKHLGDL